MLEWFDPKTSGRLIFDDRPYVFYDVVPNGRAEMQLYRVRGCSGTGYTGTIVFHMKAYEPYGKLTVLNADGATLGAENETLLLPSSRIPTYTPGATATSHTFLVYNPGTKPTPLVLNLAGASTGTSVGGKATTLITNQTNDSQCRIIGMTEALTTDASKYLSINSRTGRVTLEGTSSSTLAFEMHDYGYVWLSPCRPFIRQLTVTYTANSNIIDCADPVFTSDMVGLYIYLRQAWRKITTFRSTRSVRVEVNMPYDGTESNTSVLSMNRIAISGARLSTLQTVFTPRVR